MDILSRVAAEIGQHLELDEVLDTALTEIFSALRVSHGCIYLFDRATGTLKIKAERGLGARFLEAKGAIKPGEGCAGTSAVTKEVFVPTKAERHFVCKEPQALLGLDCLAAIPIITSAEVLGVLELFAPMARRLTSDERELVEAINNQLGVAIKNASTYKSLQHALDDTKKLLQATETITATLEFDTILEYLARLACELTQVSRAAIAVYDADARETEFVVGPGDRQKGFRQAVAGKTLQTVYEKGRAVTVYDLYDLADETRQAMETDHVKSILIVPLTFAGKTLGALYLDEPYYQHKFAPWEIELAEGIARHAAAAIQNSRSFESKQQALANAEALLQASEMVATILDPDILLNQLARLAPKLMGINRAGIWLFDKDADELKIAVPPTPDIPLNATCKIEGAQLRAVLYQGKVLVLEDWSGLPDPIRRLIRRANVKSLLLAPLHYGSEIIGLLMLYDDDRPHNFPREEIDLAEAISHLSAIGVINARSFAEQRRIAETLQQSFIPSHPPRVPTLKFGVGYRSVSEGAFVGGDFYDFLQLDGSLGVCIGDVSGHGIEAASLAGVAKSTIRAYALERPDPASVLGRTNKIIVKQTKGHQFITLVYGLLDLQSRVYKYVSAGHPPPLLIYEGEAFLPTVGNLPIGVRANARYRSQSVLLPHNSFLILYTDGLIEARRNKALLGPEGLRKAAAAHCHGTAQELVDGILNEVETFSAHKLVDDIAIVALAVS
ncbi:MAG: SpoIIE family protein phosphatase [Actinomycetota bacterium]|nr:SpoIIE family protein phosphatase [Actinomycetota bacterium]